MRNRTFGRTGWSVGEVGYGMWGMGGWTGSDDAESAASLDRAIELGCSFFDTAWAYGEGRSERLLAEAIRRHPDRRLYSATKIPPKNREWPSRRGTPLADAFPPDYVREYVEKSLENLGLQTMDLIQFHVWEDPWIEDERLQRTIDDVKREGLVRAVGISINRWEPWNGIAAVRSGLIDAVQVIYNIFDQSPEDELFPACRELAVAVIARVPFDEGSLTGTLALDSTWPSNDWRSTYFVPENLRASVEHADALRPLIPAGTAMAEMALRFILSNPDVSVVIPGMRRNRNVEMNIGASDAGPLPAPLLERLRAHRWDRTPTSWSQ